MFESAQHPSRHLNKGQICSSAKMDAEHYLTSDTRGSFGILKPQWIAGNSTEAPTIPESAALGTDFKGVTVFTLGGVPLGCSSKSILRYI